MGYILSGMHIQVDPAKWSKTTFRLTWAMLRVYSGWGMVCYATCLGVLRNPLHVSNLSSLKVSRLLVTYDIGFRNIFELFWCLRMLGDIGRHSKLQIAFPCFLLLIKSRPVDHLDLDVLIYAYGHGCDHIRSSLHVKQF